MSICVLILFRPRDLCGYRGMWIVGGWRELGRMEGCYSMLQNSCLSELRSQDNMLIFYARG